MVAKLSVAAMALFAAYVAASAGDVTKALDQLKADTEKVAKSINSLNDDSTLTDALPVQEQSETALKDTKNASDAIKGLGKASADDSKTVAEKISSSSGTIVDTLNA